MRQHAQAWSLHLPCWRRSEAPQAWKFFLTKVMPGLNWYWHRLQSMDAPELAMHWRKKILQASEKVTAPKVFLPETLPRFPVLPSRNEASDMLLQSLRE